MPADRATALLTAARASRRAHSPGRGENWDEGRFDGDETPVERADEPRESAVRYGPVPRSRAVWEGAGGTDGIDAGGIDAERLSRAQGRRSEFPSHAGGDDAWAGEMRVGRASRAGGGAHPEVRADDGARTRRAAGTPSEGGWRDEGARGERAGAWGSDTPDREESALWARREPGGAGSGGAVGAVPRGRETELRSGRSATSRARGASSWEAELDAGPVTEPLHVVGAGAAPRTRRERRDLESRRGRRADATEAGVGTSPRERIDTVDEVESPARLPELPSERLVRGRDGVWQVPTGLAGARVAPPWLAVGGAALVVVVAVAAVVLAFVRGEPRSEPVATRVHSTASATAVPGTRATRPAATASGGVVVATQGAAAPAATPAGEYLVHVVGKVRREGVVAVPAGARVSDAIAKAGGAAPGAVLTGLNLARPVVDGEQIVVPDAKGAPIPINTMTPPATPQPGAAPAAPGPLVDLNTADQAALESLPGVGPALATRILEWRAAHGRFTSVDELGEVSGIGEKKLEDIRPKVRV